MSKIYSSVSVASLVLVNELTDCIIIVVIKARWNRVRRLVYASAARLRAIVGIEAFVTITSASGIITGPAVTAIYVTIITDVALIGPVIP